MWKIDNASNNKIDLTAQPAQQIPERTDKWVFSGYLAYAFLGCPVSVPSDKILGLYTTDGKDLDKKTQTSRKYVRTNDKLEGQK